MNTKMFQHIDKSLSGDIQDTDKELKNYKNFSLS